MSTPDNPNPAGDPDGAPPPPPAPSWGAPEPPVAPSSPPAYGAPPPAAAPYGTPPDTSSYGTPPATTGPGYGTPAYGAPYGGQVDAPFGYDPAGRPYSDKSKVVAGVLGILLGFFGAGRFYTGHTGLGVAQLVVSILTCGIGSLWGLIDGILILVGDSTDAKGRPLRG